MSAPNPLNQAVIAQALYDLRNGQLRRCKAMGFGEEELDALKHPALISVLANANVSWCSVSVNREVLRRLLKQAQDVEKEIATVDRMLRLARSSRPAQTQGAPSGSGRGAGHRAVAALEGRDQQQECRAGG